MVETRAEIPRHFDVLDLIAADRHLVRAEQQNVGGHQHRIHEQSGRDAGIGIIAFGGVFIDSGLVGMRAVEQPLAGHAGQQPGQFRNFGNIGLPVKPDLIRIQSAGQPGRGDFQRGLLDARRILHFDQRMVIGEEIETFHTGLPTGGNSRADGTGVIAQMRRTGGGDAGQDTLVGHGN